MSERFRKKLDNSPHNFNSHYYRMYYDIMENLCLGSYVWEFENLNFDSDYLERILYEEGKALIIKDCDILIPLRAVPIGLALNGVDGETWRGITGNGINYDNLVEGVNCVLVKNNKKGLGCQTTITMFAREMAESKIVSKMNMRNQRTPLLFRGSADIINSLKNAIINVFTKNQHYLILEEDMKLGMTQNLETRSIQVEYLVDKLRDESKEIYHEALDFIGILNNSSEKTERLIKGEILLSNGLAISNRQTRLDMRTKTIEQIQGVFNVNASVQYGLVELGEV